MDISPVMSITIKRGKILICRDIRYLSIIDSLQCATSQAHECMSLQIGVLQHLQIHVRLCLRNPLDCVGQCMGQGSCYL